MPAKPGCCAPFLKNVFRSAAFRDWPRTHELLRMAMLAAAPYNGFDPDKGPIHDTTTAASKRRFGPKDHAPPSMNRSRRRPARPNARRTPVISRMSQFTKQEPSAPICCARWKPTLPQISAVRGARACLKPERWSSAAPLFHAPSAVSPRPERPSKSTAPYGFPIASLWASPAKARVAPVTSSGGESGESVLPSTKVSRVCLIARFASRGSAGRPASQVPPLADRLGEHVP